MSVIACFTTVILEAPESRRRVAIGNRQLGDYKFSEVASLSSLKPSDKAATISARPPNKRIAVPTVTNK
jgi:hypothetical protein